MGNWETVTDGCSRSQHLLVQTRPWKLEHLWMSKKFIYCSSKALLCLFFLLRDVYYLTLCDETNMLAAVWPASDLSIWNQIRIMHLWLCHLPGCAPATLRSFWFQYGSLTRSWRAWHPSGRGRGSLWWSTGTFHRHTITVFTGLFSCSPTLKSDFKAPEERGCDRSVQPAGDQLVGLEEHGRRVLGDFYCKGLSDGYQGGLWSNSLPATWRSTRLLRQWFW